MSESDYGAMAAVRFCLQANTRLICTPLHMPASRGHTGTVKVFVELGGGVLAQDGGGLTPLHYAAAGGHL
jgi:ankyrin repeat protein